MDHDISARYLIGCDGAHSEIRRKIGARLSGFAVIDVQSTYIRAPTLLGMMPALVWAIDCINPRSRGLVFAIDGRKRWLVHSFLKPGESPSAVDRPRGIREILGMESEFVFDILGREDWTGRRMVADRFRDQRVILLHASLDVPRPSRDASRKSKKIAVLEQPIHLISVFGRLCS